MITIKKNCFGCGVCVDICPVSALKLTKTTAVINRDVCIGCGICSKKCPVKAIKIIELSNNSIIKDVRYQVTKECNFECPWCFSNAKKPLSNELSLEEALLMTEELISCGLKTMTLTGGEPLLRKDFSLSLLRYLHYNKIYTKLFTNGSLLNEEIIDNISCIVNEVQISAYNKNFLRKMRLIFSQLKRYKIRTALRITLTSKNYNNVKELVDFAERCAVDVLRIRPFIAQGRGLKHQDYLMDKQMYKESIGYLASIRRSKDYPIQLLTPSFPFLYDKDIVPEIFLDYGFIGYTLCKCIEDMGAILPDGSVRACSYFPQNLGNVRKQNFREIWSERNKIKKELIVGRLDKECMDCIYIAICGGGCRADAYVNTGSLTKPDPMCPLVKNKSKN